MIDPACLAAFTAVTRFVSLVPGPQIAFDTTVGRFYVLAGGGSRRRCDERH